MVGCLGKLYESIENLNETYIQPNQNKDFLLKSRAAFSSSEVSLLMLDGDDKTVTPKFYMCPDGCNSAVTNDKRSVCSHCRKRLNDEVPYVGTNVAAEAASSNGGFVKGVVTFMVMDDLVVQPMSTISGIALLNKFNVKEVGALQEKIVHLGITEGLKLLKASLQCDAVLTSVFVKN